ncbi:MAG: rhomboid family intramembrane serine protease [Flavobacteriales bacterium]|nr:rhomboid family intramembrane serine protease [Flavobacteriales bacterium]
MSAIQDEINKVFKKKDNQLIILIFVNVAAYLILNIIGNFGGSSAFEYITNWFTLSSEPSKFITHFWTIFTYMFVHYEFMGHLLFNMLWLYWMGQLFESQLGSKRLMGLYLLGGLAGGVLYFILYLFIDQGSYLLGASAGVMAIVIAVATLIPNQKVNLMFIGPVALKYVAAVIFILTSITDFQENTGGKIAHIGGALMGYIYIIQFRKGKDYAGNFYGFLTALLKGITRKKSSLKVAHKRPETDDQYQKRKSTNQRQIDIILDKISKSGYESLSAEEKRILFDESNKN